MGVGTVTAAARRLRPAGAGGAGRGESEGAAAARSPPREGHRVRGAGSFGGSRKLQGRVEVAVAARPDSATSATGGALCALEASEPVEALAAVAVDLGPAAAQLRQFELMPANERMGKEAPVAIMRSGGRVGAEDDRGPLGS